MFCFCSGNDETKGNTVNINVDKQLNKVEDNKQKQKNSKKNINAHHKRELNSTQQNTKEERIDNNKERKYSIMLELNSENNSKRKDRNNKNVYKFPFKSCISKGDDITGNCSMMDLNRNDINKRFHSKIESNEFQNYLKTIIRQSFTQKEVSESDDDD